MSHHKDLSQIALTNDWIMTIIRNYGKSCDKRSKREKLDLAEADILQAAGSS